MTALILHLLFFLLRLLGLLPIAVLLRFANLFSFLLSRSVKVKHISKVNLALCFPELTESEREKLLVDSFDELGKSIAETLVVWFKDVKTWLQGRVSLEAEEHWQTALAQGRGVIMLSCHSGSLDLNVALLNHLPRQDREFAFTYRQPSNKTVDNFLQKVRRPYADYFFPVGNLLGISRVLKKGGLIWYAPDIETSKKGRVFAKFMGVEAATPVGIAKLAESSGAIILPYMHRRDEAGNYQIKFFPHLELDVDADITEKTTQVNAAIEKIVREQPAAYWWCIKRFRYRQDGGPSVYKR